VTSFIPTIEVNNGISNIVVKEDGSVFVPVKARLTSGSSTEFLTVSIGGIDPSWTIQNADGTYNPATGTWTITMPAGTNYTGGLTFKPPANSDADLSGLVATAKAFDSCTCSPATSSTFFCITTDAVADAVVFDARGLTGNENTSRSIILNAALTDTDGSEAITGYKISGVPTGFTFNQGTNLGGGVWSFTPAQIVNLKIRSPLNFNGTISLTAKVLSEETTLSGKEVDISDNKAETCDAFTVTWRPVANTPTIQANNGVDDAIVKEDGSIFVPVKAALTSGSATEVLTVTVTGINPAWTIQNADGTYNPATGTWTITMPAGTNYTGGLTFKPPANSDADLSGLTATAKAVEPATGTSASASDVFRIITDAVADKPTVHGDDATGNRGTALNVVVGGALTDTDGSEAITGYQISGVPTGFTFNQGTNLGGGVWSFTPAQLAGLKITPTAGFVGSLPLTVTVLSAETTLSGAEPSTADNTNSATDPFTLTWRPVACPPTVQANNGVDDAIVKEDGSIFVPVKAALTSGSATEVLTVTVTGINPAWTIQNADGTYNPATGTWTITMPAGTNYTGGLTFKPPANSDADLSGLTATAKAVEPATGTSASASDVFRIITDAVADKPTVHATGATGAEDTALPLVVNAALTDTDGSETLAAIYVRGVPAGFALSTGTSLGGGTWQITPAQLAGLKVLPPANFSGQIPLQIEVVSRETSLSGVEISTADNQASTLTTVQMKWTPAPDAPTLSVQDALVKEDGSVFVPLNAALVDRDGSEALSVTVSGVPAGWSFMGSSWVSTSVPGQFKVTLPAGTDYAGGFTLKPPANSDADIGTLQVKVSSTETATGAIADTVRTIHVTTDAVADKPDLCVNGLDFESFSNNVLRYAFDITTAVTDTDGSESIDKIVVSGLPAAWTLSAGTHLANGDWVLTPAQLPGLDLSVPVSGSMSGYYGITVTSWSKETTLSGSEVDYSDNMASCSTTFGFNLNININNNTNTNTNTNVNANETSNLFSDSPYLLYGSGDVGLTEDTSRTMTATTTQVPDLSDLLHSYDSLSDVIGNFVSGTTMESFGGTATSTSVSTQAAFDTTALSYALELAKQNGVVI
jgi:hypothetical protein